MMKKTNLKKIGKSNKWVYSFVFLLPLFVYSAITEAIVTDKDDIELVRKITGTVAEHCDGAVASEDFLAVFECGDAFFDFRFNAVDGGGGNVGDGGRYTRLPRADLAGSGGWADHFPRRATGPNAAGCVTCHNTPVGTAAGPNVANVIRDPLHSGIPAMFIQRNTPHLMGSGALQLLAEEMTTRLHRIRDKAIRKACHEGDHVWATLKAKGVQFGKISITPKSDSYQYRDDCEVNINYSHVQGIDDDLVIKPFSWKGSDVSLRKFTIDAFNNEIGMQPVETTGTGVDGDNDGVTDEVSVADVTAMVIYLAGQTRPHTQVELDRLRRELVAAGQSDTAEQLGLPVLTKTEKRSIKRGKKIFREVGCTSCHKPAMVLKNSIFREPARHPDYNIDALNAGLDPEMPISFDLSRDMPDNRINIDGEIRNLANLKKNKKGYAIVELFSDLKRHDMGSCLAENIDETGTGASVWMTKELWGIGGTGQYLHDGRATTIEEAILEHCGEGNHSRQKFEELDLDKKKDLVRFIENLVILKTD